MIVSDGPKLIICEPVIVYKPKPKRIHNINSLNLNISKKNKSEYLGLKFNKKKSAINTNFDSITFKEIEEDFKRLKSKSEIFEVENELIELIETSTNDRNFKRALQGKNRIKRPTNFVIDNNP